MSRNAMNMPKHMARKANSRRGEIGPERSGTCAAAAGTRGVCVAGKAAEADAMIRSKNWHAPQLAQCGCALARRRGLGRALHRLGVDADDDRHAGPQHL